MKKYYQLLLIIVCLVSVVTLLIYRHEYYRLGYVLEVLNFFGKPGNTNEITLCNYGINASILTEKLDSINAKSLDTPPYFQRIDDNHYAYSSYWRRNNPHSDLTVQTEYFGVSNTIVLGSKHVKQNFRCQFLFEKDERPTIGKFSYSRLESKTSVKENKDYVAFIFHCKLTRALGVPYAVSFYPNTNFNPIFTPLIRIIDLDRDYKSKEEKNMKKISFEDTSKITACVMPNKYPNTSKKNIIEFLSFHKLMGITEYHVYDNMLPPDILERIQTLPIELSGISVYTLPFNYPFSSEDSYHLMRDLAELDCIFRNLNRNKKMEQREFNLNEKTTHLVNLAWDEYIVPRYHYSLKALLKAYETGKTVTKIQVPTLHFCLNQRNDAKVKPDYPDIVKKTHYDKSTSSERPAFVLNIGSMKTTDIEISTTLELHQFNEKSSDAHHTEKLTQDVMAIHKYLDCRENGHNRPLKDIDMDFADFEARPHQFEGAMFRFAENIYNSKLYSLYRMDKIWPTSSRDMF